MGAMGSRQSSETLVELVCRVSGPEAIRSASFQYAPPPKPAWARVKTRLDDGNAVLFSRGRMKVSRADATPIDVIWRGHVHRALPGQAERPSYVSRDRSASETIMSRTL